MQGKVTAGIGYRAAHDGGCLDDRIPHAHEKEVGRRYECIKNPATRNQKADRRPQRNSAFHAPPLSVFSCNHLTDSARRQVGRNGRKPFLEVRGERR